MGLWPFIGAGANGTLTDTPAPAITLWAYPYNILLSFTLASLIDSHDFIMLNASKAVVKIPKGIIFSLKSPY